MSYYRTMNKKIIIICFTFIFSFMALCVSVILFLDIMKSFYHTDKESPINDPYGPPSLPNAPSNIDKKKWLVAEYKGQIEYYKGISAFEESNMEDYYANFVACSKDDQAKAILLYNSCSDTNIYTKENELSNNLLDNLPYATRLYFRYKGSEIRKTYADKKIIYYKQMVLSLSASEHR